MECKGGGSIYGTLTQGKEASIHNLHSDNSKTEMAGRSVLSDNSLFLSSIYLTMLDDLSSNDNVTTCLSIVCCNRADMLCIPFFTNFMCIFHTTAQNFDLTESYVPGLWMFDNLQKNMWRFLLSWYETRSSPLSLKKENNSCLADITIPPFFLLYSQKVDQLHLCPLFLL